MDNILEVSIHKSVIEAENIRLKEEHEIMRKHEELRVIDESIEHFMKIIEDNQIQPRS